jgi:hypothetical protein
MIIESVPSFGWFSILGMGVIFLFHGLIKPGTVYLMASLFLRPGHQFRNGIKVEVGKMIAPNLPNRSKKIKTKFIWKDGER